MLRAAVTVANGFVVKKTSLALQLHLCKLAGCSSAAAENLCACLTAFDICRV